VITPPNKPPHLPLTTPATSAGKRLVELHTDWVRQYDRAIAIEGDYRASQDALRAADSDLQRVLTEAELKGGKRTKAVTDAEATYAEAKAAAEAPWEQRARAAVSAANAHRGPFEEYLNDHLEEVVSEPELVGEAEDARTAVLDCAQALADAFERYQEAHAASVAILGRAEGVSGQDVPMMGSAASAANVGVRSLLEAQTGGRPAGGQMLPTPCVSKSTLDRRAIDRGEAEVVEVDGPAGKGVQVVSNT